MIFKENNPIITLTMLSQLAQWQQSRKVFFLRATHQQWNEVSAEERDPLQRPF